MKTKKEKTLLSRIIFFILCFLLIFTTLAYGTVHQPTIMLFYLLVSVLAVLWVADSYQTGIWRFHKTSLQIPLILAIIYAYLQIIPFGTLAETGGLTGIPRTISLDPFWTQMFALHFLALLFFFSVMLVYLDSADRLRKITSLITIFGFLFAFFAILQYVLSPTKIYGIYETSHAAQSFGSFVNRHNFAAFMEMAIAVPLGLLFVGAVAREKRLIYLTAIGLMGVALLMSGSRGGLIALLSSVLFMIFLTGKTKSVNQIALKVGLAALLLVIIVAGAIFVGGESALTRFAETAGSDDFTANRWQIWSVTIEVIRNNLPFGAGIGAFATAYTLFDPTGGTDRVEQAHNDYLQVLADAGIIGFALAVFFIVKLFQTGLKHIRTENLFRRGVALGALSGCFAVLIHSLFDFVLHTTAITLMFLTLVSLVVVSDQQFEDDERIYQKRRRKASVTPIEVAKRKKIENQAGNSEKQK